VSAVALGQVTESIWGKAFLHLSDMATVRDIHAELAQIPEYCILMFSGSFSGDYLWNLVFRADKAPYLTGIE